MVSGSTKGLGHQLAGGRSRFSAAALLIAAALLAPLSGCDGNKPVSFANVDVTGANYGKQLSLTDQEGQRRTLDDYRGKVVALFFGFTHCPDVCPTALQEWKQVRQALGAEADKLQVIFVTLDPERDTAELLKSYVTAFDPGFVALRGSAEETATAAKEFKVFYQKNPGKTADSYTLDHTAASFLIDQKGQLRLFVRSGMPLEAIVGDVRKLLKP